MNPSRAILYFVGIILVIAALSVFFFETGLDRWIPASLLAAGILLIIGLAVMSFAESAPAEHKHGGRHDDEGGDVTVVNK